MNTFILQLLLSTAVVSLLILSTLLIKKVFSKHLSTQAHYKIWYFLFIPLIGFLFPWQSFHLGENIPKLFNNLFLWWKSKDLPSNGIGTGHFDASSGSNTHSLHDFVVSVDKSSLDIIYNVFFSVWFIGIVLLTGVFIYSIYQINQLKNSSTTIKDKQINEMFGSCVEIVGLRKNIKLRETSLLTSPVTLGFFRPYIIIPKEIRKNFTVNELKYVILHELSHQKNKDTLVNYAMWIFRMIYWFNPLIWYASKKIRVDQELACDITVLNLLNEKECTEYGYTIIRFADKSYPPSYEQLTSGIGGTKQQIKQRILTIANYSKASLPLKRKSIVICSIFGAIVLLLTPMTAALASPDDIYQFDEKNVVYEDLGAYFDGYDGSFVLYDSSNKQYQVHNRKLSQQRVSPDSTYKIYSALFGLEANVITANNNERDWNGTIHPYKEWNKDQTLSTAMSQSVNWYFKGIDQEVGKEQLQYYFNKINYGNGDLSADIGDYWMASSLKISPMEQVKLLSELGENKYNFKERNIYAIEKALLIDQRTDDQLYGKTGTGAVDGKSVNGWFIGFVKKADRTYYFAVNIQNENGQATGSMAAKIATRILHDKNIY